jgi:hypothetical protein
MGLRWLSRREFQIKETNIEERKIGRSYGKCDVGDAGMPILLYVKTANPSQMGSVRHLWGANDCEGFANNLARDFPRCDRLQHTNGFPLPMDFEEGRINLSAKYAIVSYIFHTQRHRSTPFHHTTRSHSSRQVLAHCRLVHQRVPNCVSSRAAATEKDFPCTSWRKMLIDRRVW